ECLCLLVPTSHRRRAHAAVLVLLAAATWARVIAADPLAVVADRLLLLVALLTAGDGRVLLAAHALLVDRHGLGRRLVHRRLHRPERLLKIDFLSNAEPRVGHLVLHAFPHGVKFFHALPFVFRLRIDLGITHQADAAAEVVHGVEMVLPGGVEP